MTAKTQYRIQVRDSDGHFFPIEKDPAFAHYRLLDEGPWDTREQAETFAQAEVGYDYRIVEWALGSEPAKFVTSDGYTLEFIGGKWTDGDMVFDADSDGDPIDTFGEKLDGVKGGAQ